MINDMIIYRVVLDNCSSSFSIPKGRKHAEPSRSFLILKTMKELLLVAATRFSFL